ncbi:nuclear pore complex protein NUP160 isoform X1 [Lactuca sativa]|nr:nuclear pore complex protein NUP160 isoform X1 [Lactuca sativa]
MVKLGGQHLLTMVNQNILKEKTSSGMLGVNNERCTLLHLLGCCLLSQAHLQSSWGSTEKKVNEAVSCFFFRLICSKSNTAGRRSWILSFGLGYTNMLYS